MVLLGLLTTTSAKLRAGRGGLLGWPCYSPAFGALGLVNYKQCPDEDRAKKRFGRCSVLLALGGLSGLVGAVAYRSLIAAAALKLDATNEGTNTCAAGCALSLSAGLIAVVAGVAAVYQHKEGAATPRGEPRRGNQRRRQVHLRCERVIPSTKSNLCTARGTSRRGAVVVAARDPLSICRTAEYLEASSTVKMGTSAGSALPEPTPQWQG